MVGGAWLGGGCLGAMHGGEGGEHNISPHYWNN